MGFARQARRVALVCVGASCIALGASNEDGLSSMSSASACPSRSQAPSLPRWTRAGLLHGHIDGDTHSDTVSVHYSPRAPISCSFFLVVNTAHGNETLRIPEFDTADRLPRSFPYRLPVVEAVVNLGGRGDLIAVAVWEGASNLGVEMIGNVETQLKVIPVGKDGALNLYGFTGGTVTHAGCARGGPMRVLSMQQVQRWATKRWGFSTVTYHFTGTRLALTGNHTIYGSQATIDALATRAGFYQVHEFAGCAVSHNGRF